MEQTKLTPEERKLLDEGKLAYPRCDGCGHNFFDMKPRPTKNGRAVTVGYCEWCIKEMKDDT
ncbi:MAG TPA: hypothetical protein VFM18_17775 [Methanosarcina sp.]|nr:hypothetical protein [Methanosarcina sp.]